MKDGAVAITGIGVVCALGTNVGEFWTAVKEGRSGIRLLQQGDLADVHTYGSEVDDVMLKERVDEIDFDGRAGAYDRIAQMSLIAVLDAMAQAGLHLDDANRKRVGIITGKCQLEKDQTHPWTHSTGEDVAHYFGFEGPRTTVSTACTAGAHAIGIARDKLLTGEADVMFAGGVDTNTLSTFRGFEAMQAFPTGPCAPYSRSDGLNLGEGAAYVLIERIDDALARGAEILAEFAGYGLSADAHHATAPDPTGRGAASAVRRALEDAELDVDAVDYVNGHGTGTLANDKMERKAMRSLFGDRVMSVPISSTKSVIGHTLGGSGAVEAVACVMAIQDNIVPPTINFDETKPDDLDFVPNTARAMKVDVAVSNNYAFGGNNCSVVVKRYEGRRQSARMADCAPVLVTGLGTVSAYGVGIDTVREAFAGGRNAFLPVTFDPELVRCSHASHMCELEGSAFASPANWRHMDTLTRQALAAARLALADAGTPKLSKDERESCAVFMGTSFGPVATIQQFNERASALAFSQLTMNAAAGKVCEVLGVRGPTVTITTGALSGTIAFASALEHIQQGKADRVIVVGTDELFDDRWRIARRKLGPACPDADTIPYDERRTGAVLGAAAVAIVLERASSVVDRDRRPYCEIAATYQVSDSSDRLGFDPSGRTMTASISGALARAGVDRDGIDLVVGRACGTDDDMVEARAVAATFGSRPLVCAPAALTGDCEAASGLFNVIAAALAIRDGIVPPIVGLDTGSGGGCNFVTAPVVDAKVRAAVTLDGERGSGTLAIVCKEAS